MCDLITLREFEAIFRCYHELLKDSNNVTAVIERVALIFQVSTRTVNRVLATKKSGKAFVPSVRPGKQRVPQYTDYGFKEALNDFIFIEISKNEPLTMALVYEYAKECLDFPYSQTTLYRIIKTIGYKYKKVDRTKILIETPRIINLRIQFCAKYLQLLKEAEKGNLKFVYLDETWMYQNGTQICQWVLESNKKGIPHKFKGEGRRYTIVNAGCDDGFLPGCDLILNSDNDHRDYHKTMNGKIFKKWISNQLIPALRSLNVKCVIILDNAPYHSMRTEKPPTLSSKKTEMQTWLTRQNIQFEETFTKKQLWGLIQPRIHDKMFNKYEVDEMLKSENHEVLRLPPYNCQYNPIELAWGDCKTYYNKHIQRKLDVGDRVVTIWQEARQHCTQHKWKNFIKKAENEIKQDWKKYMGVETVEQVPPFIINIQSDTSDSEFNDFDDSPDAEELESDEEIVVMVVDDSD